ncbi:SRPBCC family protein [Micromonospora sp. CPCC 206061]|uniref:SRPBCC family protein n=1 Tax=Micromonospora sp. CPCC 206061 TaxID=3122410 RepID=UPI002FEEDA54
MSKRHTLTGRLHVALPPEQAFRLFTARGEEEWAAGWRPHFPVPTDDDTAPGTVFVTDRTTWVVLDRTAGRHIRYARVVPGISAGTVAVTLEAARGGSDVTVTYDLTALTDAAGRDLDAFAASYPDFLNSWHQAITTALTP